MKTSDEKFLSESFYPEVVYVLHMAFESIPTNTIKWRSSVNICDHVLHFSWAQPLLLWKVSLVAQINRENKFGELMLIYTSTFHNLLQTNKVERWVW